MFFWNLPHMMAVTQAQMLSDACDFWARSWSRAATVMATATPSPGEPWLDCSRGGWPHVHNCAASAYSKLGVHIGRLQPANSGCYETDCREA